MSSTAKHTPGPWYYDAESMTVRVREWKRNLFMGDYRGCIIAGFEESHGGQPRLESLVGEGYAMREVIDANARLIAAAPELLDVLRDMVLDMDHAGEQSPAKRKADQLIARIEGVQ